MERERAAFALHAFKAIDDRAGLFEGYLAVFGNLDGNGDIIDRGSFTKTLKEAMEVKNRTASAYLFPILWQHQENNPIGGFTDAHEDEHGLFVRGQYDMDIPEGQRAYSGSKKGYLRGLSIGYYPVKTMWDAKHVRHLLEIRLFEGSPVTFPANEEAMITQVKAVSGSTDWPIAPRDTSWDAGEAHGRLLEWAGGKDKLDVAKFKSVHFWSPDGDATANVSDYKFPFCDIIGGSPKAVYGAISAGAGRLGSAKGVDVGAIKSRMTTYYSKMADEFKDPSIVPPWSKAAEHARDLKQMGGLQTIIQCAACLDANADSAGDILELLANACGMSMDDGSSAPDGISPQVAALLSGIDGLEDAIKGVVMAYKDWDDQTDALLAVLGLPDDDSDAPSYGPAMMSETRSALLELKVGRQLSASTHARLTKAMDGISGHVEDVKSLLKEAGKVDENANDINIDQRIAAGKGLPPKPDQHGTTSDRSTHEPSVSADTLAEFEKLLFLHAMEGQR